MRSVIALSILASVLSLSSVACPMRSLSFAVCALVMRYLRRSNCALISRRTGSSCMAGFGQCWVEPSFNNVGHLLKPATTEAASSSSSSGTIIGLSICFESVPFPASIMCRATVFPQKLSGSAARQPSLSNGDLPHLADLQICTDMWQTNKCIS